MSETTAWRFEAIGTAWQIDAADPLSPSVRDAVSDRVEAFDRDWSRFRAGSVVDAVRAGPGRHRMPDDAGPLLELYDRLHTATGGAVSPAVGDGLEHLGYDARYSLRPGEGARAAADWGRTRWRPPHLETEEPFVLDVGAAGKGYLADLVADVVETGQRGEGVAAPAVVVDASGDLVRRCPPGARPLRVALEHPARPGYAVGVAELDGAPGRRALCASAVNRRTWGEGLHHVLDARTGAPTRDITATWVVADTGLVADGLATALFFLPADAARSLAAELGASYARMTSGNALESSPDLHGELFT